MEPSGTGPVDVSVLVPVLNEAHCIRDTVRDMQAQRLDGEVELIFVDGGSDDGTRQILDELAESDPRLRVLHNPGRTTPRALNIGLAAARGRFVARMDAHTFYERDYLKLGVERLRRGGVDWVSGPAIPHGTGKWSRLVALATSSWLGVGNAAFRSMVEGEVEVDTGFVGVWRRETLEEYGGWDEGWPLNQDGELAGRFRADGRRILCLPEMAARYVPRDSLPSLARQYWRYGQYRVKTSRRHPRTMRRSQLLAPGLVLTATGAGVAPRPVRTAARAGLAVYAASIAITSARQSRASGKPMDALLLPAVFATMHLAWGAGFLVGSARFGPPLEAVAHALSPGERERTRPQGDPREPSPSAAGAEVHALADRAGAA